MAHRSRSPGRIAVHARLRAPDRPIGSAAGMPRTAAVPGREHTRSIAGARPGGCGVPRLPAHDHVQPTRHELGPGDSTAEAMAGPRVSADAHRRRSDPAPRAHGRDRRAANAGATAGSTLAIAVEAGVLLGAAYMASGRLWLPIALHAGWNLAQLGLLGVQRPGHSTHGAWSSRFTGPTLLTGGNWGPEISLVAVALCLAAAVALVIAARRRGRFASPSRATSSP